MFPVKIPKVNFLSSAKVHLDKDVEYEQLDQKYMDQKEKDIFS